jgi:hypothetical protein
VSVTYLQLCHWPTNALDFAARKLEPVKTMNQKFRLFRRSREQQSLRTSDPEEARGLLHARNEADRQPAINRADRPRLIERKRS